MFFLDTGKVQDIVPDEAALDPSENLDASVWVDEDDDAIKVSLDTSVSKKGLRLFQNEASISGPEYRKRLRQKTLGVFYERPKWATQSIVPDDNGIVTYNALSLVRESDATQNRNMLLPDIIDLRRYRDVNYQHRSKYPIKCIDFSMNRKVLVLDQAGQIILFDVDGKENKACAFIHAKGIQFSSANFLTNGEGIVATNGSSSGFLWRAGRLHRINGLGAGHKVSWTSLHVSGCGRLIAFIGTQGYISVASSASLRQLGIIKITGNVSGCCFDSKGENLFVAGSNNKISVFSTRSFECSLTYNDLSGTVCTGIAISPNDDILAVGSNLGILSLYNINFNHPNVQLTLRKTICNLTTSVSSIAFHPSGELVAYASRDKKLSARFVHIQTGRVFSNWPKSTTPLCKATTLAFDSNSSFAAIGNNKGCVLLYGLRNYE